MIKNKGRANIKKLLNKAPFWAWLCFFLVLSVYVASLSKTIPPYRDSGELITAAATLSIAHSPGYPVYMILGKAAVEVGSLAGFSAAVSMNLLSALCGAFAVFFLFLFIYELTSSKLASAFGALAAGFSYMNWYLAVVAEMYALNLMLVALLLFLAVKKKYIAAAFVAGLTLGNHLTSLFAMLPVVFYFWLRDRKKIDFRKAFVFFLVGISVYFYHILRSLSRPFINWGNPSSPGRFLEVVTRAAYGHTLDLVSREVTLKQVFIPHLRRFFVHLFKDMTGFILFCSLGGVFTGLKKKGRIKDFSIVLIFMFILTGPLFLYMAKMPVNPHSSAIVEVSYMIPEMVLAVFGGIFLAVLLKKPSKKFLHILIVILGSFFLFNAVRVNLPKADHNSNFFARDYALNILKTVDENAFILMRRDHPLFSLWYMRDIQNIRDDVKVVALGLISASWYRKKLRRDFPKVSFPGRYESDTRYVNRLISLNAPGVCFYMTDAAAGELGREFHGRYALKPWGLVGKVYRQNQKEDYSPPKALQVISEEYKYNGEFYTHAHYDYFTKDFIRLYASSFNRLGLEFLRGGETEKARELYLRAVEMEPLFFRAWSNLAYSCFRQGQLEEAVRYFEKAVESAQQYMNMYTRKDFFIPELAEILNSLGAVYERKYRKSKEEEYFNKALKSYDRAIELKGDFSRAYFNRGVLYWSRGEWESVVENFHQALRHDPGNAKIKRYLERAERNLQ